MNTHSSQHIPNESDNNRTHTSRHIIKSFKAKADAKRTTTEKAADWLTEKSGTVAFLIINILFFLGWILLNTGVIPGITPFDPFPFGFMTTAVSLEAIILAVVVLISQNREATIADIREEIDLQVNVITENEITKLLEMVTLLLQKQEIDITLDKELKEMLKPINVAKIEKSLERQINTHQRLTE
ncbi:MAG: DUF1003 domain-containing protein [Candidatus Kerfeldbacteria bacterium]|nr:DUF1003 domain-containing protein [Candidatus Kerfeldbacteria bacterium]